MQIVWILRVPLMNVMSDCTLQEVARENQTEQDLLQFMKAE